MSNYEINASPYFYRVTCPKHNTEMFELKTGLLEESAWYCEECQKPYQLKPVAMRKGTYDQDEINNQLKGDYES